MHYSARRRICVNTVLNGIICCYYWRDFPPRTTHWMLSVTVNNGINTYLISILCRLPGALYTNGESGAIHLGPVTPNHYTVAIKVGSIIYRFV